MSSSRLLRRYWNSLCGNYATVHIPTIRLSRSQPLWKRYVASLLDVSIASGGTTISGSGVASIPFGGDGGDNENDSLEPHPPGGPTASPSVVGTTWLQVGDVNTSTGSLESASDERATVSDPGQPEESSAKKQSNWSASVEELKESIAAIEKVMRELDSDPEVQSSRDALARASTLIVHAASKLLLQSFDYSRPISASVPAEPDWAQMPSHDLSQISDPFVAGILHKIREAEDDLHRALAGVEKPVPEADNPSRSAVEHDSEGGGHVREQRPTDRRSMDAFTVGILQRIRNAEADLHRALESGDEFLVEVERSELHDLRRLAAEHGVNLDSMGRRSDWTNSGQQGRAAG